jgi:hypothetical protein
MTIFSIFRKMALYWSQVAEFAFAISNMPGTSFKFVFFQEGGSFLQMRPRGVDWERGPSLAA